MWGILDKPKPICYNEQKFNMILIKSDGGNRPYDVRQPAVSKVLNPAVETGR